MKNIVKYLKLFAVAAGIISCSGSDEKEFAEVKLVPIYSLEVSAPSAANNTLSGYKSVAVPSNVHIYKEKDLIIHYIDNDQPLNYNVVSVDESSAYVPAEDVNPAVEGKYKVSYSISSLEEAIDEDTGAVTTTQISRDYMLEVANTDIDGNALDNVSGLGLTVTETKIVTTVVDKVEGDVAVPEVVVPATDNEGEITTVITVDDTTNKTTTKVTTVATAISEVVVVEEEIYN